MQRLFLRSFRAVQWFEEWIRHRFTPAGLLVLGGFFAGGLFGVDVHATLAYQILTLCMALLALGLAGSLLFRGRFEVTRRLPRFVTAGEPAHYVLTLSNHTHRIQRGLFVREQALGEPPSPEHFRKPRASRWRGRRALPVGYHRWLWHMFWLRGAYAVERPVPEVAPGESVEVEIPFTALRRGRVRLGRPVVGSVDPLGLVKTWVVAGPEASLLALPRRYPVRWVEPGGVRAEQRGAATPAAARGGSEEFMYLREYRPGDPKRHVDWKSWARLGEPVVKEFMGERLPRQALVLDTATDDPYGERFEEAVSVAASFVCPGASPQGGAQALELVLVGSGRPPLACAPGVAPPERLLEALACVEARPDSAFGEDSEAAARAVAGTGGCVCILLDWDAARRDFVRRLRGLGAPLLVLVVVELGRAARLHPGPMGDAPARFRALEVGGVAAGLAALAGGSPSARAVAAGGAS